MNIVGIFLLKQIRTGGDRRYLELMEALAEKGHFVIVIMNSILGYKSCFFKQYFFSIDYTYRGFPPASFLFKRCLRKNIGVIKNIIPANVDFIHIHGDTHLKAALFLHHSLKTRLFYASRCNDIDRAYILRRNHTLTLRKYLFSLIYEPVNRFRERQIARFAELVTFQNSTDRDLFAKRTNRTMRTVIIPGNIGLPRCKPEWRNKNKSTVLKSIIYVGSLHKDKGLFCLLDALKILLTNGVNDFFCYLLGREDNMDTLKKTIRSYRLDRYISIEGYKDPFPYYAKCDILIYPTFYDAFPDTVLEALHTGCPVIASNIGGIPDILGDKELLVDINDIEAIASKINMCIMKPAYYHKIRELCGKRAALFRFDWAGAFEKVMLEYRREQS
jgi:glycosyltransferase involved in cell wall biosynthesis